MKQNVMQNSSKKSIPTGNCRVCGYEFFEKPLLRYENMPRVAQFLPDSEALETDRGVNLEVCQCSGCGLVQLSNGPVPYYKEVIRSAAFSKEMKEFRLKQFGRFVERFHLKDKKVVEVGCGCGEYLSLMSEIGADCYGLEFSEESVSQCVNSELNVSKGYIETGSYKLSQGPFDAFYMLNFLEHLPEPNDVLTGISNNLVDDAIGLVEVPNFDMILKKNLFSEFTTDHLIYFTKQTLLTTLNTNGFEVIDCEETWYDYIISAVVRKRKKLDISTFYKYQDKLKSEVHKFIDLFKERRVAIWGAGHQALAVISMTSLAGRVKYVVDSAPFKQGKYTPASHIPIVSPSSLIADPVDAVIVMAASYSDEVLSILCNKFGEEMSIAVLRDTGLEII